MTFRPQYRACTARRRRQSFRKDKKEIQKMFIRKFKDLICRKFNGHDLTLIYDLNQYTLKVYEIFE